MSSENQNRESFMKNVTLITDGACIGNPGPGGWAYILRIGDGKVERSGGASDTTNNQMELAAVIEGLKALQEPCELLLISDSRYLLDGLLSWRFKWRQNGWMRTLRNGRAEPVKNMDLWQELDALANMHTIRTHWIKGHSGHPDNERCDELAEGETAKYVDLPCLTGDVSKSPL
jgi:ribonuclease HI